MVNFKIVDDDDDGGQMRGEVGRPLVKTTRGRCQKKLVQTAKTFRRSGMRHTYKQTKCKMIGSVFWKSIFTFFYEFCPFFRPGTQTFCI